MGYFRQSLKGITWVSAFRILTRLIALIRTVVLARILSPTQFGLFGIATLAISFLEIFTETGINVFLIQEKDKIEKYINTAWVVSIVRGILITLFLLLVTPAISNFFNSPNSKNLLYLIAFVPLIRGFINPLVVKFQKELQFDREFRFKTIIFLVDSSVAIILAFILRSPSSLVWGLIVGTLIELFLSHILLKPAPKLIFEVSKLKQIINRGKWLTGAGIFQYLFRQGDNLVVGKILGEAPLGIYQQAYKISTLPISEVSDVVARVTFPVYTRISGDLERLKKAFLKTTIVISLVVIPFGILIFIFSEEIVLVILGEKWLGAVPALRILSIYGVLRALINPALTVFLALKKQEIVSLVTFVSILGLSASIVPLVNKFGIVGAGMSTIVGTAISYPIIIYFSLKLFK